MKYESFFNSEEECLLYEMHFVDKYKKNFNKDDFYIRRDNIQNALFELKDTFSLEEVQPLNLQKFHLYNENKESQILNTFKLMNAESAAFLHLVTYNYEWHSGKSSGIDFGLYVFGDIFLPKDYKNVGLRPEVFGDKIKELFKKDELTFRDYPNFNKKFYVMCENKENAKEFFTLEIANFLELYDELHLEIINNRLLFRPSKKAATPIEILETIQALFFISEALNK